MDADASLPKLQIDSRFELNDGNTIPALGFGVYRIPAGDQTLAAVTHALKAGYRHIDTASIYKNEADVGRAINESNVERAKIYVTTKLWNSDQGHNSALPAFEQSLKKLQLDYVDLYLLHWPVYQKRIDSWRALNEVKASGRCLSIGVSNFMISHLQELMDATGIVPVVNQIEFSPFLYQRDLLKFCQEHNILIESYCPLTAGQRLEDPSLKEIAQKYQKTPAQVLIRWNLQHHLVPLPKSKTPSRIVENSRVFDFHLDIDDMNRLDSLNENFRTSWDPSREK